MSLQVVEDASQNFISAIRLVEIVLITVFLVDEERVLMDPDTRGLDAGPRLVVKCLSPVEYDTLKDLIHVSL